MRPVRLTVCFCIAGAAALQGCTGSRIPSPADLPIVYKIDVQQGNVITQDMLAQLEPGMDKAKVRYIMGTPLVVDVFHQDRWDYVYTEQKRGGHRLQRRVSLYFRNDRLERVAGDVKPAAGDLADTAATNVNTTVDVPGAEEGLGSRLKDKVTAKEASQGARDEEEGKPATATTLAPAEADDQAASDSSKERTDSPYAVDNSTAGDIAPAAVPEGTAGGESADTGSPGDPLLPVFQSESDRDEAVSGRASETEENSQGAPGASETLPATQTTARSTGEVVIPDDAPAPPQKGFFRRMLEKVGVGDNEGGDYESAEKKYKDPSDPESSSDSGY